MRENISGLFFPHDDKPDHFRFLDGLRGIAILLVLASHSSNANIFFHDFLNFEKIGKVGVYLFFVLSAYLIDRQIALVLRSGKSSKRYWKNYFLRRFLRIYPLYFVALISYFMLTYVGIPTVIDGVEDVGWHLLLLKGESIFWSIPVEFKYYFISPLIIYFCHKILKWRLKWILYSFSALIISSIAVQFAFELSLVSTVRYLPIFLVGTSISIVEVLKKDIFTARNKSLLLEATGFMGGFVILLTVPYYFEMITGHVVNFHHSIFYFFYALLWVGILIAAKYGTGFLKTILELNMFRFIGVISYSMYLFHQPILLVVNSNFLSLPQGLRIYAFILITVLGSSVSYLLIEKPLSKIRLSPKSSGDQDRKKRIKIEDIFPYKSHIINQ